MIIEVTNEDETGKVSLYWSQPQTGIALKASVSDPDGDVSGETWVWQRCDNQAGTTNCTTLSETSGTYTPVAADETEYLKASVTYTDAEGSGKSAEAVSEKPVRPVPNPNAAPGFSTSDYPDGTATRSVQENSKRGTKIGPPVTATDSDSHDPNDTLRYELGGTDGSHFNIVQETGQLKVRGKLDREKKDEYTVTVTAKDPSEASSSVTVTIQILDEDEKPVVTGDRRVTFAEDSDTLVVTRLHGVDPEGKNVGWVMTGLSSEDSSNFRVGEESASECGKSAGSCGVISFRSSPDFENPADDDRNNVYEFNVMTYVTDHTHFKNTVYTNVRVEVTNGEDGPTVIGPSQVDYLETRTDAVASYAITMQGGGNIDIELTGDDAGDFRFVSSTGNLEFSSQPIYASPADDDQNNVYLVALEATSGNLTTVKNVTVSVLDYNYPPVVGGPTTPSFAENGTGTVATYTYTDADQDTVTWTPGGDDAGLFDISADGELTFDSPPDFETPADADTSNDYEVTVQAYDGTTTVDYPVTVTVGNVNEAPSFGASTATRSVDENTAADQDIGAPVGATDVDADDTIAYSLDATSAAVFGIDSSTGQLKTKAALDHESTESYDVTVTVRDAGSLPASIPVTINVGDVNEAPQFPSGPATREVAENTATNVDFGDPVEATDEDESDSWTYSLEGADASSFDIDTGSGQLKTLAPLNHENKDSYSVTVVATDSSNARGTIDVTITVGDVNEAPAFPSSEDGARSIPENTAAGQNIGAAVAAEDQDDGDTLTYNLGGTDAGSFDFDTSTGQIKTKDALDYEGGTTSYSVTVSVHDGKDANGDQDTMLTTRKTSPSR